MATAFPTLDEQDTLMTPPPQRLSRSKRAGYVTSSAPRAMSSSAAKRRSVVALGSIQHLQHFYAKQKVAEPSSSPHPLARPMPALLQRAKGGPAPLQISEEDEEAEEEGDLPPTPLAPDRVELKPYEDVEKEEAPTLEEAWREVDDVCRRWGLVEHVKSSQRAPSMSERLSQDGPSSAPLSASRSHSPTPSQEPPTTEQNLILSLLTATTAAIRLVQRYVLALPPLYPESTSLSNGLADMAINDSPLTVRHHSQLGVSTAARPRTSANALPKSAYATPSKPRADDPLAALRRASLDVLTALREMEVHHRLSSKSASPLPEHAFVEEEAEGTDAPVEGHLYRDDVTLDDLRGETHVVREWVETADRVLTASSPLDSRIPRSPTRLATTDSLPDWTHTSRFADHPLTQSHALLTTFLPSSLRSRLGSADDLLDSLADGQLLCLAYNAALRSSHRPWGFVPPSAIHDLSSSSTTVGRTFRRFENLRVLAAAMKLRYGVSLDGTRERARSAPPSALGRGVFDARTVARRDSGWEGQLELLVRSWTEAVVYEAVEGEL